MTDGGPTRDRLRWHAVWRLLPFLLLLSAPALAADVVLSDDAYHQSEWADGKADGLYTEWWYFNLYDSQGNLQAIFVYLIIDPTGRTGIGFSQVTVVVFTPDGIVSENDTYPTTSFSASSAEANVQIESNSVEVVGDLYEIKGSSRNSRVTWDLQYIRQAEPWYAADRMSVGALPWAQMSWLIYMPRAEVAGQVIVDGDVYPVEGVPGYHDHNWGEWFPTKAMWNWAQYSEPGFALGLGDFIGQEVGVAGIDVEGERTVFTRDQYEFMHLRWALDAENGVWYPVRSLLFAQNDSLLLILTMTAEQTDPLRGDLPLPLRDVIIYEQTARYRGLLWQRRARARWSLLKSIDGGGFKEYTAAHY